MAVMEELGVLFGLLLFVRNATPFTPVIPKRWHATRGLVEGPLGRQVAARDEKPCNRPACYRPSHFALQKHLAWTPMEMGWLNTPAMNMNPPNLHEGGTGQSLPWVVPRKRSDPSYSPSRWVRRRPHGDQFGPRLLECKSVEPFKFYLMEEAKLPGCPSFSSGEELMGLRNLEGGR